MCEYLRLFTAQAECALSIALLAGGSGQHHVIISLERLELRGETIGGVHEQSKVTTDRNHCRAPLDVPTSVICLWRQNAGSGCSFHRDDSLDRLLDMGRR